MNGVRQRCLAAVLLGLGVFAFTRVRASLPFYVAGHRWLHEQGVPAEIRNLDASLLLVLAALAAARISTRGNPLRTLGLLAALPPGFAASLRQAMLFALVASIPMVSQAAIASAWVQFDWDTAKGTLIAPFVEETFFRGLLVTIPISIAACRFWPVAIVSSLLFGAMHVPWSSELATHHVWPFLITGCGGLWYAWIVRIYNGNLWTTIFLHSFMNAAWLVFSVDGGAVGSGLWSNLGRALTIALGTVLALRHRSRQS